MLFIPITDPTIGSSIIVLIIGLFICILIGIAYAYFSAGTSGSEDASTIVAGGGTLRIVYEDDDPAIILNGIYPRESAWSEKNFTITGTNITDLKMNYKINLIIDNNKFTSGALTYSLSGSGESIVANNEGTINNSGIQQLGLGQMLTGEEMVHSYNLYDNENSDNKVSLSGWRIFDIDKTTETITLISAANPVHYFYMFCTSCGYVSEYILSGNINDSWSQKSSSTSNYTKRDWKMYENNSYGAHDDRILTYSVLRKWYRKYIVSNPDLWDNNSFRMIIEENNLKYLNLIDNHTYYWLAALYDDESMFMYHLANVSLMLTMIMLTQPETIQTYNVWELVEVE